MPNTCSEPACDRDVYSRGLCSPHYQKARSAGALPPYPPKNCEREGCPNVYTPKNSGSRFCSRDCIDKARTAVRQAQVRRELDKRHCAECGDPLSDRQTRKAITCSPECAVKYQNRKKAEAVKEFNRANQGPCELCGEKIPEERRSHSTFCSPECKKLAMGQRWRRANPHYNRWYLYGLSQGEFEAMLEAQNYCCASCGSDDWAGKDGQPHVDHDHRCCPGKTSCGWCIRGLLCADCNQGGGYFQDDPALLRAAADYFERTQAQLWLVNFLARAMC